MHILAAELMGQCRVAPHPPFLLVGQLTSSDGYDRELCILSGGVGVGAPDPAFEVSLRRDAENNASPDLPGRLEAAFAHEADELTVGMLRDDSEGRLTKSLQRRQTQVALQRHCKLRGGPDPLLTKALKQVGRCDVDQLEVIHRLAGSVF